MVKIFTPPFNLQKFSDQLPQLLNQQNILKSSSSKQVSEDQEMYLWRGNTLNRVKCKFWNCISLGLYPSLLKFLLARDFVSIFVSSLCHAQETSFSIVLVMCEFSRSLQPFECTSRDISWRELVILIHWWRMKNKGLWKKIREKIQEDVASLVNLLGHRFNHIVVSYFMA